MTEVASPPSRKWFYKDGDEFIPWQGDLIDKNDVKPNDDAAVAALKDMIEKVNQTIESMEATRDMRIELGFNENDLIKVTVSKQWV